MESNNDEFLELFLSIILELLFHHVRSCCYSVAAGPLAPVVPGSSWKVGVHQRAMAPPSDSAVVYGYIYI